MAATTYSVVIPTRNRRADLLECLASLRIQSLPPAEIVIVDASRPLQGDEQRAYQSVAGDITLVYTFARPTGAASQRNQGLRMVRSDSAYVVLLDDDVVLDPNHCGALVAALDEHPDAVGAGGNITNWQGYPYDWWVQLILRLFMMEGRPGRLLFSGQIGHIRENQRGAPFAIEWLQGCTMAFRRAAIVDLEFDTAYERFAGYAFNEDLDFSYTAGRRGQLLCVPDARLVHKISSAARVNDYRFDICQVANRALFVQKHLPGRLHFLCFLWSMLGTTVINALMSLRGRSYTRLLGNLIGLALVLTGQVCAPQPAVPSGAQLAAGALGRREG